MPETAILIGLPQTLQRLERQLDLLADRPITIGWVLAGADKDSEKSGEGAPVLGLPSSICRL